MVTISEWLKKLEEALAPLYVEPNVLGGHDFLHVRRMLALAPKILGFMEFSEQEFQAAVWLHNLDRARPMSGRDIESLCWGYLEDSPFGSEAKSRIVDAVLQHSKKDDEPGDSSLLTALRIADKAENLGAMRILACVAHRGGDLPLYNPDQPFGYRSIEEGGMTTLYENFMRSLRWYGMLPCDEARKLVPIQHFQFFVDFVRQLGAEIAEATGHANEVEADIKRAINEYGDFYHLFC